MVFVLASLLSLSYLSVAYGHAFLCGRVRDGNMYISVALNHRDVSTTCGLIAAAICYLLVTTEIRRDAPLVASRSALSIIVSILFMLTTLVRMDISRVVHKRFADSLIYSATVYMLVVAFACDRLTTPSALSVPICCLVWYFITNRYEYCAKMLTLIIELACMFNMLWLVLH